MMHQSIFNGNSVNTIVYNENSSSSNTTVYNENNSSNTIVYNENNSSSIVQQLEPRNALFCHDHTHIQPNSLRINNRYRPEFRI